MNGMRRGKVEILYTILNVISKENPIKKTQIMFRANLSYDQLEAYLKWLEVNGHIMIKQDRYFFVYINDGGLKFLGELKSFLDRFGERMPRYPGDENDF